MHNQLPMPDEPSIAPVLRYPGGKQRILKFLSAYLPPAGSIGGRYIEPFVGGASVFLHVEPHRAILSDSNAELIDLYRGIKLEPLSVWRTYASFLDTKDEYIRVRRINPRWLNLAERTARLLYLNRTCFKGNWRHNSNGHFNIGYGGQSRRWVINLEYLSSVSKALASTEILCSDFEGVIELCKRGDFIFLDPPYSPGQKELINDHYVSKHFSFSDHERLASALWRASQRGARWCMTTSGHPAIIGLFRSARIVSMRTRRDNGLETTEVLVIGGG